MEFSQSLARSCEVIANVYTREAEHGSQKAESQRSLPWYLPALCVCHFVQFLIVLPLQLFLSSFSVIIFQMEKPLSSTTFASAGGVVTCMQITPKYIIVGLDNGQLHGFDHECGNERVVKAGDKGLWCADA